MRHLNDIMASLNNLMGPRCHRHIPLWQSTEQKKPTREPLKERRSRSTRRLRTTTVEAEDCRFCDGGMRPTDKTNNCEKTGLVRIAPKEANINFDQTRTGERMKGGARVGFREVMNSDSSRASAGASATKMEALLTPNEAANILRLSKSYLAKLRCSGSGPRFTRLGAKHIRYPESAILAWIDENLRGSTSDTGPKLQRSRRHRPHLPPPASNPGR